MKAVILAGGLGTRLAEETASKPKPMVELGGRPILWHVLKIYAAHGIHDFVICLGYKGYVIKDYFKNYLLHTSDVTIDLAQSSMEVHDSQVEPWRITLAETGHETQTGGRLRQALRYIDDAEFCCTYGDGVGNIDIGATLAFHRTHGKLATVTAVRAPGRFGGLSLEGDRVRRFEEKPPGDGGWINGGFFVLSPEALRYVDDDRTPWEAAPLEALARDGQLAAYRHEGFWHPLDTPRDRQHLDRLARQAKPPWMTSP
ncbi:MAG: glucose-1-phosphate cytidylyltransferase [Myxococcota bacterium]